MRRVAINILILNIILVVKYLLCQPFVLRNACLVFHLISLHCWYLCTTRLIYIPYFYNQHLLLEILHIILYAFESYVEERWITVNFRMWVSSSLIVFCCYRYYSKQWCTIFPKQRFNHTVWLKNHDIARYQFKNPMLARIFSIIYSCVKMRMKRMWLL